MQCSMRSGLLNQWKLTNPYQGACSPVHEKGPTWAFAPSHFSVTAILVILVQLCAPLCIPKGYSDEISQSLVWWLNFPSMTWRLWTHREACLKRSTPDFGVTASSSYICKTSQAQSQDNLGTEQTSPRCRFLAGSLAFVNSCFRSHVSRGLKDLKFCHLYCNKEYVMLHYGRQEHCLNHQNLVQKGQRLHHLESL